MFKAIKLKHIIVGAILTIIVATAQYAVANEYKVLKVIDGDTFTIIHNGKYEKVRLLNVDTPESKHPDHQKNILMGKKAAEYTRDQLENKIVSLEFDDSEREKYGRLLCYVFVQNENFNIKLVQQGFSPYYTKYGINTKYHAAFVAAEKSAKKHRLNIWKDPDWLSMNRSQI